MAREEEAIAVVIVRAALDVDEVDDDDDEDYFEAEEAEDCEEEEEAADEGEIEKVSFQSSPRRGAGTGASTEPPPGAPEVSALYAVLLPPSKKRKARRWLTCDQKTNVCGIGRCVRAYGSASALCAHKRAHHPGWKEAREKQQALEAEAAAGPAVVTCAENVVVTDEDDEGDREDEEEEEKEEEEEGDADVSDDGKHTRGEIAPSYQGSKAHSSKYRGVSWHKRTKRWRAQLKGEGQYVHNSYYHTEKEAARAYNEAICRVGSTRSHLANDVSTDEEEGGKEHGDTSFVNRDAAPARKVWGRSKFRGVTWNKRSQKWQTTIIFDHKRKQYVGGFQTEKEAALAYNAAARRLGRPDNQLNDVNEENAQHGDTAAHAGAAPNPDVEEDKDKDRKEEKDEEETGTDGAREEGTEHGDTAFVNQASAPLPRKVCGRSKFRGVTWRKQDKRWIAGIQIHHKCKYVGSFQTEKEAALAYNAAARRLGRPESQLNDVNEENAQHGDTAAHAGAAPNPDVEEDKDKDRKEEKDEEEMWAREEGTEHGDTAFVNHASAPTQKGYRVSKFRGVVWRAKGKKGKKWRARIRVKYKLISVGEFQTEKEAALAYNVAVLNFSLPESQLNDVSGGSEAEAHVNTMSLLSPTFGVATGVLDGHMETPSPPSRSRASEPITEATCGSALTLPSCLEQNERDAVAVTAELTVAHQVNAFFGTVFGNESMSAGVNDAGGDDVGALGINKSAMPSVPTAISDELESSSMIEITDTDDDLDEEDAPIAAKIPKKHKKQPPLPTRGKPAARVLTLRCAAVDHAMRALRSARAASVA